MGKKDKEREEFIRASSSDWSPYARGHDNHPAMMRRTWRRIWFGDKPTRGDWIAAIVFLGAIVGIFLVAMLIAWIR